MGNIIMFPSRFLDWIGDIMMNRVDINWPLPDLQQPCKLWRFGSSLVIPLVGTFAKVMAEWLNTLQVYNQETLYDALDNRPQNVPLITVSNHNSCLDEPTIWGTLKWSHYLKPSRMRWSLAAHDICFTKRSHALFFGLGKVVPVVRGNGVYQRAIDFCIERLNEGDWLHIFPEGKVNLTKEFMRIKWGVGRIVSECNVCPIVIPMWHVGMDNILPNVEPYRPKTGKRVTLLIGHPIELAAVVQKLRNERRTDVEQRKTITDIIQEEMRVLKENAEKLHFRMLHQL